MRGVIVVNNKKKRATLGSALRAYLLSAIIGCQLIAPLKQVVSRHLATFIKDRSETSSGTLEKITVETVALWEGRNSRRNVF